MGDYRKINLLIITDQDLYARKNYLKLIQKDAILIKCSSVTSETNWHLIQASALTETKEYLN